MEESDVRALLARLSIKKTEAAKLKYWPDRTVPEPSDKAKKFRGIIDGDRYDGVSAITKRLLSEIISEIIGEKVDYGIDEDSSVVFTQLMMVVPTRPNGHNYPMGVPALAINDNQDWLLKPTGEVGNHIFDRPETMRAATPEEIKGFFTTVPYITLKERFQPFIDVAEIFTVDL